MVWWDIGRDNHVAMVGIVRIEDVSPENAAAHHAGVLVGRQVQKSESQLDIAHLSSDAVAADGVGMKDGLHILRTEDDDAHIDRNDKLVGPGIDSAAGRNDIDVLVVRPYTSHVDPCHHSNGVS
jgi:hypothetical protein